MALAVAGERAFKRADTAVLPFSEPSALVATGGPFAFAFANSMYLGLVLCLLGWAVLLDSLVPFAVVPALFALIHFQFVLREEPLPGAAVRQSLCGLSGTSAPTAVMSKR